MRAGDILRTLRHRGDLIDVQRRSVGEHQRARLHHLIQFGEDRLFDVHFLEHRFDDDVAILDVVVSRHRMDAGEAAVHFIFFQTAAFDRGRVIGPDPFHAAIERFLRRIHDLHVVAEIGERHGDAAAHRAGSDHGGVVEVARLRGGRHVGQFRGLAFGEERVAQRFGLVGVDEFLEQFALALHALVERQSGGGLDGGDAIIGCFLVAGAARDGFAHRLEDLRPGLAFFVTNARQRADIGDLASVSDGALAQIGAFGQHLIQNAERLCFRCRNVPAGDDHFERGLHAGQPRQTLRAAAAGQNADQHFRQSDFRGRNGDAVMAAHRVFQPAAERVTMDRGDDRFRRTIHDVIGPLADRHALAVGVEAADIGTGDEAAAIAHQHHRLDRRIGVRAVQAFDDALGDTRPERIDRRIIDDDDADVAVFLKTDHG